MVLYQSLEYSMEIVNNYYKNLSNENLHILKKK